nr:DUF4296 domain-containing protein [uncultured Psychroserpens sp.]
MRHLVIYLLILLTFGCGKDAKPEKPDDLISKDKMVDVLYDTFVLNTAKGTSKSILENHGIYPENYIFKKHNIDSLQFALSNEYYGFHVEEYESIIARVEDRFNNDKDRFQTKIDMDVKEVQRKKDSIKRLSDSIKTYKSRKIQEAKN